MRIKSVRFDLQQIPIWRPSDNHAAMSLSAPATHRTRRPLGAVLAALALWMQLWAGQASATHLAGALVQGMWRSDVCSAAGPQQADSHTLQALCISEHCPACSAAGHNPLPPAARQTLQPQWHQGAHALNRPLPLQRNPARLRPPAQAPPAFAFQAPAAAFSAATTNDS